MFLANIIFIRFIVEVFIVVCVDLFYSQDIKVLWYLDQAFTSTFD